MSATGDLARLLSTCRPTLIVVSGAAGGMEYVLDQPRVLIGRGPGVDLVLDESLERVHAELEYDGSVFRIVSLSTGRIEVNGGAVEQSDLKDGDRLRLGGVRLVYSLESRPAAL
ncbi:MAG: FHA domain-containing protein [Myxococcota bacterium]